MSEFNFKVGDRVRFKANHAIILKSYYNDLNKDTIFVVTRINDGMKTLKVYPEYSTEKYMEYSWDYIRFDKVDEPKKRYVLMKTFSFCSDNLDTFKEYVEKELKANPNEKYYVGEMLSEVECKTEIVYSKEL